MIYIIKQEGLYQNKVNSSLVFTCNCGLLASVAKVLAWVQTPPSPQEKSPIFLERGGGGLNVKLFLFFFECEHLFIDKPMVITESAIYPSNIPVADPELQIRGAVIETLR